MARARTLATVFFAVLILAPYSARADGITLTKYSVAPTTIYPSATSGALATTTTITLGFSQRVKASITIEDATGAAVRALYSSSGVTTPTPKVWDGKDDHGAVLAPGAYTILVSAATSTLSLSDSSQSVTIAAPPVLTPPPFPAQQYTLSLVAGWNLLSTPVVPSDARVASVFATTSADAVWSYDPSNPAADSSGWLVYDPAHPELSNLASVAPGEGYFVHASAPGSVSISGALFAPGVTPPSRSLAGGWNLVGSYAASSEDIDSAFASIGWAGIEYTSLWKLDAASQTFALPSAINPGDAFWILLDAPHTYAPANL
jgi:hypothetical protein